MRRRLSILLLPLLAGCLLAPDAEGPGGPSSRMAARLGGIVDSLAAIPTRFMHDDAGRSAAVDWIAACLAAQGTPAQRDSFRFFRTRWIDTANLEVRFPGRGRPGSEVIVGAHWDAVAYPESFYDSTSRAPGADDNASGVAALIELARLLKHRPTEHTVRVVFLAAEEIGHQGAYHLRDRVLEAPGADSLVCFVCVDMLGYEADAVRDAGIVCNAMSRDMAESALPSIREALTPPDPIPGGPSPEPVLAVDTHMRDITNSPNSDHLMFWYSDLPALELQEGPDDTCPAANSAADTTGNVDPQFLADGTRALLALVLHLAVPAGNPED
ncbi:MAG: M20/M25/M40 family metallo-hydrolase [Candidatus Krumholzibacteriota bacterium]|nr:M20/M25/M40 family metallo-hydrolase [Candidatus Krumholzibacteriota bacterium]